MEINAFPLRMLVWADAVVIASTIFETVSRRLETLG
jgi:hypothetical protein